MGNGNNKNKNKKENDIDDDDIPKQIVVVVDEDDDDDDDANPFRFEAMSPIGTIAPSQDASYMATRRNSSPAAGCSYSTHERRRSQDSIPQMPLPLSHRQHQDQRVATATTDADAAAAPATEPEVTMFRATPFRRSSCPYYLGGRASHHSLHLLQQALRLSPGDDENNPTSTIMTTAKIVDTACEIAAEAAFEQTDGQEHQNQQQQPLHHDEDDCPETERPSGLAVSVGDPAAAAASCADDDDVNMLDVPPTAPKRKASTENLMSLKSSCNMDTPAMMTRKSSTTTTTGSSIHRSFRERKKFLFMSGSSLSSSSRSSSSSSSSDHSRQ
jgi:hypothetical protein